MKKRLGVALAGAGLLLASATGIASADSAKVDGFVCPVLFSNQDETPPAAANGPFAAIGEGHYTIPGPVVSVGENATTTGTPGGEHAQPGDTDYTAIWEGTP